MRTRVHVAADGFDRGEHLPQVPGDGDAVHRIGDLPAFHPEPRRAARVIAGDRVHALPHQLGDQQPAAHARHQRRQVAGVGGHLQVVHAAGIGGGLQPELARRIAAQHVARDPAALHQRRLAGGHALAVEGGRTEAARQERQFRDPEPVREHLGADAVEQEAGLAIQRAAADRADIGADQRTRHFRREQYRHLAGRQLPRLHPRQRALGGLAADGLGRLQVRLRQRDVVPMVALHAIAGSGDQRATDAVGGAALGAEEPVRVGVHADAGVGVGGRTVRIGDARVHVAAGGLAGQRGVDRARGVERARVPLVELADVARHQRRIRKARGGIFLGVARDRAGLGHGGGKAVLAQVGGAGTALALAEVHGHRDPAIAGRLHGFDLAHAHVDRKPGVLVAGDVGLAGARGARPVEHAGGDVGQALDALRAVVDEGGCGGGNDVQWLIL